MKTWEMIKELTENPDKVFRQKHEGRRGLNIMLLGGNVVWEDGGRAELYNKLNWIWEEVKKPVDFMTTVKSGKRIRVEHPLVDNSDNNDLIDYTRIDGFLYSLGGNFFSEDARDIIQNGKFYIED